MSEDVKLATLQEHQQALLVLLKEFDRVCRQLDIPYILFAGSMLGAVRHKGFIPWDDDLDILMLRPDYERFLAEAGPHLDQRFYLQKEFSEHWPMYFSKLRLNGTTCLEKYHPKDPEIHQGVYIDLFPCDSASDHPLVRRLQFYASKVVIAKALDTRGYDTDSRVKKLFMGFCKLLPRKFFYEFAKGHGDSTKYVHVFFGGGSGYEKSQFPRVCLTERADAEFAGGMYPISADYDALLSHLYGDYMTLPPEEKRGCKKHAILVDLNRPYTEYAAYRNGMEFESYTRSIR